LIALFRPRRCSLFLLLVLAPLLGCVEPVDRRSGLWLSGDVVESPVSDWAFTSDHDEIMIETQTVYWLPHSVTIFCASDNGRLYVAARHPVGKRWVNNVDRDPEVRLKIEGRVYERRLVSVEGAESLEAVYALYAEKYGWPAIVPEERPPYRFFEVVERSVLRNCCLGCLLSESMAHFARRNEGLANHPDSPRLRFAKASPRRRSSQGAKRFM